MPDLKPPSYAEHLTIFADLLGFEEAIGAADDSLETIDSEAADGSRGAESRFRSFHPLVLKLVGYST